MDSERPECFIRLQVEMVLQVTDTGELCSTALRRIADEEYMPEDERAHARDAVQRDEAEALAYLIDPFDLVGEVPGVELIQASWSSAHTDYDPEAEEWDLSEEDGEK
ncbi:MAG: hypothetical protein JO362_17895 [Streptomycetaceae bacterium]|nr:hypothetical protein [Streptomycetaceae bacterium]